MKLQSHLNIHAHAGFECAGEFEISWCRKLAECLRVDLECEIALYTDFKPFVAMKKCLILNQWYIAMIGEIRH